MTDPDALHSLYRDIFEADQRGAAILEDLHARFGVVKVTRYATEADAKTAGIVIPG